MLTLTYGAPLISLQTQGNTPTQRLVLVKKDKTNPASALKKGILAETKILASRKEVFHQLTQQPPLAVQKRSTHEAVLQVITNDVMF
ncbi:hypothetical protein [Absidia glauca]|uniref:Uncharacterized protein n=1 Tax=Absidia glauca TaxID=4829 RepID=A0A163J7Q9_ABSGL|nr:hypothetical protein [Absidia glauca]